jgi:hypothetical protein
MTEEAGIGDSTPEVSDHTPEDSEEEPRSIKPEDHQRALKDMHRYKSLHRESSERIKALEAEMTEMRQQSMHEKENFKGLYEETKARLEEEQRKKEALKENVLYSERYRAVFPVLKKEGFRDDAHNLLDMMDLKDLDVEATTEGRFLVNGVDTWIDGFKHKYPYAFQAKKGPNVNSTSGGDAIMRPSEMTPAKLIEIEEKCKKNGDMKPYYEAVNIYRQKQKGV